MPPLEAAIFSTLGLLLRSRRKMAGRLAITKHNNRKMRINPRVLLTYFDSLIAKVQVDGLISNQYSKFIRFAKKYSLSCLPGSCHLLDNQRRRKMEEVWRHQK
jgi:hypothetical protein